MPQRLLFTSYNWHTKLLGLLVTAWVLASGGLAFAQEGDTETTPEEPQSWTVRTGARVAFVADAGLAALRTTPSPSNKKKTAE